MISELSDVMVWVLRFAWLLLVVQWVEVLLKAGTLTKPLLPADITFTRDGAAAAAAKITAKSSLARRARHLLDCFARGWEPRGVAELLGHQSSREIYRLCATGLFLLLVFVACVRQSDQPSLAWFGIAALGATLFVKGLVIGRIDIRLEEEIVAKLPAATSGISGASATEIAAALAPAIEQAFRAAMPQPEAFATALKGAVTTAATTLDASSAKLGSSISEGGDKLKNAITAHLQTLEPAGKASTDQTKTALTTLKDAIGTAVTSLDGASGKVSSGLNEGVERLKALLAAHSQGMEKATAASLEQTKAALTAHADSLAKTSKELSAALAQISAVGKEIEKILHVQQSVEGALKGVSTSEEFKKTLSALQVHLAESDKLVREASRPRKIKLVEGEG